MSYDAALMVGFSWMSKPTPWPVEWTKASLKVEVWMMWRATLSMSRAARVLVKRHARSATSCAWRTVSYID